MSLIHWWPLNGNLKDYGVENVSTVNHGTPAYTDSGKIGKAGTMSTSFYFDTPCTISTNKMSIAFWVYPNDASQWTDIFSIGTNLGRIELTSTSAYTYYWYQTNNGGYSLADSQSIFTLGNKQWYHVTMTVDGTNVKFYVNGILQKTITQRNPLSSVMDDNLITWARRGVSSTSFYKSNLNDIRIYDHALSVKEVKELSKGLVLHYNFEEFSNPNLFINSGNYTVLNKAVSNLSRADGYQSWPIYYNSLQNNTTYTLSVDFDGVLAPSHSSPKDPALRYCTMWLYFRTSPYSDSSYSSYDIPVCFTSANYNHKQISATRHQWTFTLGSSFAYYACCAIRTNTYSDGSTPVVVNFWDFKLEKSDTSTPFISNTETISKIYDSSGLGNNGTIVGNPQIVADAASGLRSIKFDGASAVQASNFFLGNEWSYGCWIKSAASSRSWEGVIIQNTNGGDADMQLGFYTYPGGSRLQSTANGQYNSSITYTYDNTWRHLFATFDGTNLKTYINGQLINTKNITNAWLSRNMLTIGARYRGGTSYDCYFAGNIDDVKIYSTVFSDSDVLAEYNRKASIDRNGNLFTGEFVEEDGANTSVDKTGVTNTNVIATTMTLDDGSIWVPICAHYVPDGLNTSRSNKYCYTSRNIWNCFGIINDAERPESGYYEFYVMQQTSVDGGFYWFRFKQNINPFSATWADVNPSKVGTNVTRISSLTTNNYAGMYWMNNSSAAMCFANGSNGNWYGCGIGSAYQGGIPGYNGQTVLGWQIVYMRVTKTCAKMFKSGLVIVNNIIEN